MTLTFGEHANKMHLKRDAYRNCPGINLESMLPLSFLASASAPGIIVVIARK